jgi:hypothetical protein
MVNVTLDFSWTHIALPVMGAGAAAVVALVIHFIMERFPAMWSNIVTTAPTITTVAACGIAILTHETTAFQTAMFAVPIGTFLSVITFWIWKFVPVLLTSRVSAFAKQTIVGVASVIVWIIGVVVVMWGLRKNTAYSLMQISLAFLAFSYVAALVGGCICNKSWLRPRNYSGKAKFCMYIWKPTLGAIVVGLAIGLSGSYQTLAGLFAVIPVIGFVMLFILWVAHDEETMVNAAGTVMLGTISSGVFCIIYGLLFPMLGAIPACIAAWVFALFLSSIPIGMALTWRNKRVEIGKNKDKDNERGRDEEGEMEGMRNNYYARDSYGSRDTYDRRDSYNDSYDDRGSRNGDRDYDRRDRDRDRDYDRRSDGGRSSRYNDDYY